MTAHDARPSPLTRQAGRRRAAVLATALLLAGCGATSKPSEPSRSQSAPEVDAESGTVPQESPSAGASQAPTGDYPIPAAAKAHTEAGAKAFATFYTQVMGEAIHRADRSLVDRYSTPACFKCRDLGDYVDGLGADDRRAEINPFETVTETVVVGGEAADRPAVRTRFSSRAYWDRSLKTGKRVRKAEPLQGAFVVVLTWTPGGWRVSELSTEK